MTELIACLDAAYSDASASGACALFPTWDAPQPLQILTCRQGVGRTYESGSFYKRELPILLALLHRLKSPPATIILDGYVWLDGDHRLGLGAILYEALAQRSPVVGVAKTRFGSASWCIPVVRGKSRRPLFVSAVGIDAVEAANGVKMMHGAHRIPTLLQLVDREARAALG